LAQKFSTVTEFHILGVGSFFSRTLYSLPFLDQSGSGFTIFKDFL